MTNKPDDGSNDKSHVRPKKDAFMAKPIILVAVLFLVESVFWYTGISFIFILLIGLLVLVITAAFLVEGTMQMVHGHYKSALSLILIIPFLILSFAVPSRMLSRDEYHFGFAHNIAYYIKFTLHEKQYIEAIKVIPPDDKGFRYKEFIWSIRFGGEGTRLIYDESDELDLPDNRRSQAWWRNIDEHSRGYFKNCLAGVYKMKSHFYVVRLVCG